MWADIDYDAWKSIVNLQLHKSMGHTILMTSMALMFIRATAILASCGYVLWFWFVTIQTLSILMFLGRFIFLCHHSPIISLDRNLYTLLIIGMICETHSQWMVKQVTILTVKHFHIPKILIPFYLKSSGFLTLYSSWFPLNLVFIQQAY